MPGLIDNHNHIVLLGIRPGYHTPLQAQATIPGRRRHSRPALKRCRPARSSPRWRLEPGPVRGKAAADAGGARRGRCPIIPRWSARRSPARRPPTRAARRSSPSKGVAVSETGAIAANAPSLAALNALRAAQTLRGPQRGTRRPGLRGVGRADYQRGHGRVQPAGHPDLQGSFEADTLASADQGRMYDALVALHARGAMNDAGARLLPDHGHAARGADADRQAAQHARRLRRRHAAHLGHRRVRHQLAALRPEAADNYARAPDIASGLGLPQHSLSAAEDELTVSTFETVNKTTPIAGLRWSLAHAGATNAGNDGSAEGHGRGHRRAPVSVPGRRPGRAAASRHYPEYKNRRGHREKTRRVPQRLFIWRVPLEMKLQPADNPLSRP